MQYVPVQFMRECNELAHKNELILKDARGWSWPVHLFHRKKPVVWIGDAQWKWLAAVCSGNKLEAGW